MGHTDVSCKPTPTPIGLHELTVGCAAVLIYMLLTIGHIVVPFEPSPIGCPVYTVDCTAELVDDSAVLIYM